MPVVVGKTCHAGVHISPASYSDPVCPVYQVCLADRNAVDFVDDSGLGLKTKLTIGSTIQSENNTLIRGDGCEWLFRFRLS